MHTRPLVAVLACSLAPLEADVSHVRVARRMSILSGIPLTGSGSVWTARDLDRAARRFASQRERKLAEPRFSRVGDDLDILPHHLPPAQEPAVLVACRS
jgi:hypothetical protein